MFLLIFNEGKERVEREREGLGLIILYKVGFRQKLAEMEEKET